MTDRVGATRLRTSDGVALLARRWPAQVPLRGAAVLVHGLSGSKDDPGVVAVAESLAAIGLDVVGYDARGHGGSDGSCTLGDHERHDVAAAVALARTRSRRVVLVGASMGAIAVLRHAADDPDLVGVVTVSSPARWRLPRNVRGVLAAVITQTRPGRWFAARRLRVRLAPGWSRPEPPVELVARLRAPLAIVHGESDRFVPVAEAHALAAGASGGCALMIVPGMGHAYDRRSVAAIVDAVEWLLGEAERGAATA